MMILVRFLMLMLVGASLVSAAPQPQVVIEPIQHQEMFDLLVFPARVESNTQGVILTEIAGVIESLDVQFGDRVSKGQLLAKIKNLDPAFQFRPFEVRSTIDGVIAMSQAVKGSHVTAGQELFQIVDPQDLKIAMEAASQDLNHLKVGTKGSLHLRGLDQSPEVEIIGVSPVVSATTGTARVEMRLTDQSQALPIGSIGRVEIRTNSKLGILVHNDAVFYRGKKSFVRLTSPQGLISVKEIELGRKKSDRVEVLAGLNIGDWLVLRSSGFLKEGAEVIVTNPPQAADENHL